VLVPPGQHTAFQLDGVLETLRLKQADRGYTAVCTQANGDDRLLCIELQKRKTVLQRMDRHTHSAGYMTAPPFSPAAYIDNLYWVVPGETGMEFGCADVVNASDWQPPEHFLFFAGCGAPPSGYQFVSLDSFGDYTFFGIRPTCYTQ